MILNAATLTALRELNGFTQVDLARRTEELGTKVSQGRISELESADQRVKPATALVLAKALGVPVAAIRVSPAEVA